MQTRTLPPSVPGALQRFHFGRTVQSAQKPKRLSGMSAKLAPMVFSGTTMTAWRTPWFASLSSAMNMSARLFPEAGGDLIRRYCSPRFPQARSCIGRIPSSLDRMVRPVRA